jgi:hypothetical protein
MNFLLVLLLLAALYGISKLGGFMKKREKEAQSGLDRWVDGALAGLVAQRGGMDREGVARALGGIGAVEPLVRILDAELKAVKILFQRSGSGRVSVELVAVLGDGKARRCTSEMDWDDLPEPVREGLLCVGDGRYELPWEPPWKTARSDGKGGTR